MKYLTTQIHLFYTGLQFLTRIPIPKWVAYKPEYLQRITPYFPVVGSLVGLIIGLCYMAFAYLFTTSIAVILSMVLGILLTGAFHEDGLADSCDAFGGGYNKDKILEIMKDSRLGTYGTTALIVALLLKLLCLISLATCSYYSYTVLPNTLHPILLLCVASNTLSRYMPLLTIQRYSYVYQANSSKSKPMASQKLTPLQLLISALYCCAIFTLLPLIYALAVLPMCLATLALSRYFYGKINGYTGDCLGMVQQVSEIIFYLTILALQKIV